MDSEPDDRDIERITLAIQKLLQEKKDKQSSVPGGKEDGDGDDDDGDDVFLSKLLSQVLSQSI